MALVVLTSVLLAMFTRTEPHPPFEVVPFALTPFLAASSPALSVTPPASPMRVVVRP